MNKGKKLRLCKQCGRKRFCTRERVPGNTFKYTCSKGHIWVIEGLTLERVNLVTEDVIQGSLRNLFDRDDTFFKVLSRNEQK